MSEDLGNNVSKRRNAPQADADAPNPKRRKLPQPEGSSRDATAELRVCLSLALRPSTRLSRFHRLRLEMSQAQLGLRESQMKILGNKVNGSSL